MRKDDADDLGLTYDPAAFSYLQPQRPNPERGKLYEHPDVNFLEEVPYRPLSWFWTNRIPWNKLTLIEGPPHSAKSLLAIELAARASRGEVMPGDDIAGLGESLVQLVSGYEDMHDTVLPRIRRAGGNISNFAQLSRVARSRGDDEPFARRKLAFPADIAHLEDSIGDVCARLVIVDPLTCFCKSGRDMAQTLELLDDLASRIDIPIIATLSAKTGRNALGHWESIPEFSDAPARCVWSIVADQDEPGRWLFVPSRMTFAIPAEGMAFRIVNGAIVWEPLPLLPLAEHDEPVAWLWSLLQRGEMRYNDIQRQAREYGISVKMLRRARCALKVVTRGEGWRENFTTIWSLPPTLQQPGMVLFGMAAKQIEAALCLPHSISVEAPVLSAENVKN
jgi:hypothetical protein